MPLFRRTSTFIGKIYLRPHKMTLRLKIITFFGVSIALVFLISAGTYKKIFHTRISIMEREFINNSKTLPVVEKYISTNHKRKPIYMITPTYRRAEQIPELTRTGQTLLHVNNLIWIVIEDTLTENDEVKGYLKESGLKYVYLTAEMPKKFQKSKNKPRGVANRNKGLHWIRNNASNGVIYFGDDDNTYDLRIFEEIRSTKSVSMFPVGLVTEVGVSSPIVKNGVIVDFYDGWIANRKFPVDMAGFAISVEILLKNPNATMPFKVGYEEDGFLSALHIKKEDIEPKAENCTKIWVWHTQTKKNSPVSEKKILKKITTMGQDSNLKQLRKLVWRGN